MSNICWPWSWPGAGHHINNISWATAHSHHYTRVYLPFSLHPAPPLELFWGFRKHFHDFKEFLYFHKIKFLNFEQFFKMESFYLIHSLGSWEIFEVHNQVFRREIYTSACCSGKHNQQCILELSESKPDESRECLSWHFIIFLVLHRLSWLMVKDWRFSVLYCSNITSLDLSEP